MTITNSVNGKSVMPGITPTRDIPDSPAGSAANVGTSRAFNNGAATVTLTPASTGGGMVTAYNAISSPGSFTATGASPLTVTGLQSATSYTFAVTATNSSGTSSPANSTGAITATTVPQAPTIGTFTDGGTGTTGTLSFTAGATGGSSITGYKYSTDGSTYSAASGTTSPLSLTGLTAGTFNFSLKSTNTNGDSAASGNASGTVIQPSAYESIATVTAAGGETSFTFSSIPSTYKHLQIRGLSRDGADSAVIAQFNGDTSSTNYAHHRLYGNGSTVTADGYASGTFAFAMISLTNGVPTSTYATMIADIVDYASTSKNKTVRSFYGQDRNGSGLVGMSPSLWLNTAAITSILLKPFSGSFAAGTTFALYGIKGA